MILHKHNAALSERPGVTVLEVLIATAIFLLSLGAISQLVTQASNRARSVQRQAKATQLCQAKLAEFVSGVTSLSGDQSGSFDSDGEEPGWQWTANCAPEYQGVVNLWNVTIHVTKEDDDGTKTEVIFSQLVFDPSQRGSTLDSVTVSGSSGSSSGTSSSGTSTGGM